MAYLALYRMFRPTTFDEVVRQEHIVKILKNQIETDKVGHAYLFCGPRGTGKTTLAKIFAKAINCEHPKNGSPCGECPTCKALGAGAALDINEIDAASNNGVEEMRDLRDKIQYPPVNGRYKVYIIDEVHMLTPSAFNAVLKTLEEPPRHAVFILATTEPQKIPATILSRCMRFDFKLIPKKDLEGLIRSVYDITGKEYEEEAISAIALAGNGSARDSLSIADMCASYSLGKLTYDDVNAVLGKADFDEVKDAVEAMLSGKAGEALTAADRALSTGKGVGVLVRDMLTFLNNLAVVKLCRNAREIVNLPDEKFNAVKAVADNADGHAILRITEILAAAESALRYGTDGRITLETAVVKAAMPSVDYDIDALISRVATLEKKIQEGNVIRPATGTSAFETKSEIHDKGREKAVSHASDISPTEETKGPHAEVKVTAEETKASPEETKTAPAETKAPSEEVKASPSEVKAPQKEKRPALSSFDGGESPFGDDSRGSGSKEAKEEDSGEKQETLFGHVSETSVAGGSLTLGEKEKIFGSFLRLFRTTRRNAVLFTLCMDLESTFEGDTFVLYTPVEAVYKSLTREENKAFIAETLATLGVNSFDIRLKTKGEDKYEAALKQLRKNFGGTDIQIK